MDSPELTFDEGAARSAAEKLPMLDLQWPPEMQAAWWRWFESLWTLASAQKAVPCSSLLSEIRRANDQIQP